jgi:glucose/arabinose dehydrogenase
MKYVHILSHAALFLALFVTGCNSAAPTGVKDGQNFETQDKETRFRVETVAEGLEVPWALAWLPNKDLIFTERPGRVRIIENGKLKAEPVFVVPDVEPSGESGLMDITLHPNFAANKYIYLAYAYNDGDKFVKVVRYKYNGKTLTEPKIIIDKIPAAPNHAGTRARFGPDGKLYVATGDSTDWKLAQVTDSLAGKILRLNDDGSVPKDNPFIDNKAYRPEIWTVGQRNPQGLAFQPGSGLLFETEHGPSSFEGKGSGGDEVNIIEAGKNYGWPKIHHRETREGMESPLLEYSPACAPASAAFYNGSVFPSFKGNFFFGCLAGTRIIRIVLDGRKVVSQEDLLSGNFGRIRDVAEGPDGFIYFSTSNQDGRGNPAENDDRILRLVPIEQKSQTVSNTSTPTAEETPQREQSLDDDQKTAVDVLKNYYAAINAKEYEKAYKLWSNEGEASDQTFDQFKKGFAETRSVEITITSEDLIVEGAAGSRFITIPVKIRSVMKNGKTQNFAGEYILRKVMVDGATAEQMKWHINSATIKKQ